MDETGKVVAVDGEFSGIISGTLQDLRTVGDEIVLNSAQAWFNGVDIYNQGTKDGRPLRFYSNAIWCRNSFGARQRLTCVVSGASMQVYPDGTDRTAISRTLSSGKASDGTTYYVIPCYGQSGSGYEGMPVDTIVFRNPSRYNYLMEMADTQRVCMYNVYDDYSTTYFYLNGALTLLDGGRGITLQKFPVTWMNPAIASNVLGGGLMMSGSMDINW